MASVYERFQSLLQALLPPSCLCCVATGVGRLDLCAGCYRELPRNRHACGRCALPVPAGQQRCAHCQSDAPAFHTAIVPWVYEAPVDGLIQSLKFRGQLPAGRLLGGLLARELKQRKAVADAIVPMPLHRRRLRERGFNQAAELARPVSRALGIPVRHGWVQRRRPTAAQAGLGRTDRQRNLRGAFVASAAVRGRRIALLDDVITTASTVDEAARALIHSGATQVTVWAVARATLHR
ncbi:ComF family protein [Aquisalimonas sp.]|uniref:ComF family protein n=1 Tax=Aquisalimonas sp. TaxID=1872621 RepID=UPI0025BBD235|nr:ComF family protein [Aquisalimonas sp.]